MIRRQTTGLYRRATRWLYGVFAGRTTGESEIVEPVDITVGLLSVISDGQGAASTITSSMGVTSGIGSEIVALQSIITTDGMGVESTITPTIGITSTID